MTEDSYRYIHVCTCRYVEQVLLLLLFVAIYAHTFARLARTGEKIIKKGIQMFRFVRYLVTSIY